MSEVKIIKEKIDNWERERNMIIDLRKSTKSKLVKHYLDELVIHLNDVIDDLNEILKSN